MADYTDPFAYYRQGLTPPTTAVDTSAATVPTAGQTAQAQYSVDQGQLPQSATQAPYAPPGTFIPNVSPSIQGGGPSMPSGPDIWASLGNWSGQVEGADPTKLNDLSYLDPKYDMLRTLSHFDPHGGITPEVMDALNKIGIGQFVQQSGDTVKVMNGSPEFNGLDTFDLIRNLGGADTGWGYGYQLPPGSQKASGGDSSQLNGIMGQINALMGSGSGGGGGAADPNVDPFASLGGGTYYNGGWLPPGMAIPGGGAAGGGPGGATTPGSNPGSSRDVINNLLSGFSTTNGSPTGNTGQNQDLINHRVNAAREDMERARKAQMDTMMGRLSDQGILGDGAQTTGMGQIEDTLSQDYGTALEKIYGDESSAADQRYMQALGLASGQDTSAADRAAQLKAAEDKIASDNSLGFANLDLNKLLGEGNLALGNSRLGLDAANDAGSLSNDSFAQLLQALGLSTNQASTSGGGFV